LRLVSVRIGTRSRVGNGAHFDGSQRASDVSCLRCVGLLAR
jgi:hypothetical protein